MQSDGKIVIQGTFGVARFLPDGALDASFGNGGIAHVPFSNVINGAVALQSDGKILVAGIAGPSSAELFAVARLNTDGSLDASFGTDGEVTTSLGFPGVGEAILEQPDGKILLGGTVLGGKKQPDRTVLARYNPDGTLDASFGRGGTVSVVSIGGANQLGLDEEGNIFVNLDTGVAEFSSTGHLDSQVTPARITSSSHGGATAFQFDGKYVFAETVAVGAARNHDNDTRVVRFTATGSVDSTFNNPVFDFVGEGGSGNDDIADAVAIQPNSKIVVAGWHSHDFENFVFALARFNPDGSFDSAFGTKGIVTTKAPDNNGVKALVVQSDGKIVAIGEANSDTALALARYLGE